MVLALPLLITLHALSHSVLAQSSTSTGYVGYRLNETGDGESATYQTLDTPANSSVYIPEPDVYLHADVHVGEIDIL